MKKISLLILVLIFALALSSFEPVTVSTNWNKAPQDASAAATSVPLTIINPLPKAASVTLKGAREYSFNIPAGQTLTKNIDKASYKYSYQGCQGKVKTGQLKFKAGKYELKIPPCKMVTLSFLNSSKSQGYKLTLKGWMNYSIFVSPNQLKQITIVADTYDYTEVMCGNTYKGKVKLMRNRGYVLPDC